MLIDDNGMLADEIGVESMVGDTVVQKNESKFDKDDRWSWIKRYIFNMGRIKLLLGLCRSQTGKLSGKSPR